jgi:hypothetical protein
MAADGNRRHWLPGGVGRLGPPNCRGVCHSRGRGVLEWEPGRVALVRHDCRCAMPCVFFFVFFFIIFQYESKFKQNI